MDTLKARILLLVLACGATALAQPAAAATCPACSAAVYGGGGMQSEEITVLPLDDPHNPFSGEYAAWDKWVFAHAVTTQDPRVDKYFRDGRSRSEMVLDAYVDKAGCLIPLKLAEERRLHAYAAGDNGRVYDAAWEHVVFAAGAMDRDTLAGYQQTMLALRAQYSLTLPGWLAANPPAWAMLLPPEAGQHAGEVIALGAPGEALAYTLLPGDDRPGMRGQVWHRYSADGQLLAKTRPGQQWWELFTPDPAAPGRDGQPSYYRVFEADGILSVNDLHSGKRAWLMDFTGQRLADTKAPAPRNHNHWRGFTAEEIGAIYAIQQGQPLPGASAERTGKPKPHVPVLGGKH